MSPPAAVVVHALREAQLLPRERLEQACALELKHPSAVALADELVRRGWLTPYQAKELCEERGLALALGSYVLLERLGKGGMGEVFRARHRNLEREDAVKRILPERLEAADALERFEREARAAALLDHVNVVRVYDAGEANGCHYIAMQLLSGEDLAKHLGRRGPLPIAEAVEYVRQACVGMQHVHEKGLVHRDLKPSNLMLCSDGVVKVMDLGLASASGAGALTDPKQFLGTHDYVAPEQATDAKNADTRADVYSLGCTLYHLLTGRLPFEVAMARYRPLMRLSHEPPAIESLRPEVPGFVADVVRKMMARTPQDRHATPGEAAQALGASVRSEGEQSEWPTTRRPPPPPAPTEAGPPTTAQVPAVRSTKWKAWLAGVVGFALAMGCVSLLLLHGSKGTETIDALGIELVEIKASKFTMGSPKDEDRLDDEKQHEVEITKDYWMGVTEVTQKQYRAVMGKNPSWFCADGRGADMVKGMDTDDFPVEHVSWEDTQAFLAALNERAKKEKRRMVYRLPTEAEWEHACRGGRGKEPFHFGNSLSSTQANFDGNFPYGVAAEGPHLGRTTKVASYPPNAFGLYDMHGNVWEWCADWYGDYPEGPLIDPKGAASGRGRVRRGGSWSHLGRFCRAARRGWDEPDHRSIYLGFRVAGTAE